MQRISLTRRLIAVVVLSQLLLAAGLLSLGVWYTRRQLLAAFDTALRGRAISVAALVRYRERGQGLTFDPALLPPAANPRHPDLYQIDSLSRLGRTRVATSAQTPPAVLQSHAAGYLNLTIAGIPYRALALRDVPVLDTEEGIEGPRSRLDVLYASPTLELNQRMTEAAITVAMGSLILLLLAVVFAAWAIRRGLLPLRELARQAEGISVRNWDFRPPPAAQTATELAPLASALDRMVAGLRDAFRRQHEFLADAAHELKTPVAILKSSLQSLLQRTRAADEYRAAASRSLEDVERLEALIGRMLRLARTEQPGIPTAKRGAPPTLAVSNTCETALDRLQPLAQSRGVRLEFRGDSSPMVTGDAEDLELVWVNLLENAIQHSPSGGNVTISVATETASAVGESHRVIVTVADYGEGIAAEELPHLFERFYRSDPSRARQTGGFGLGLPICKAIVESSGGSITVASQLGAGTRVTVTLPQASGAPVAQGQPAAR